MNLLHKTKELSRFENDLFLIDTILTYSDLAPIGGNVPLEGSFGATKTAVCIRVFYDNFENRVIDVYCCLFYYTVVFFLFKCSNHNITKDKGINC